MAASLHWAKAKPAAHLSLPLSPPSPGQVSSQQLGAPPATLPSPTWRCRRPPARWYCWEAVSKPSPHPPAHRCRPPPWRRALCQTSSSARPVCCRPHAATMPPPGRGSSPLLLGWSNSLPPALTTRGKRLKENRAALGAFFSWEQLIGNQQSPLSDVPLARAVPVPEQGSISLSTGSHQPQRRRVLQQRGLGRAKLKGKGRKARPASRQAHRQSTAECTALHCHHGGTPRAHPAGRWWLEPGSTGGEWDRREGPLSAAFQTT